MSYENLSQVSTNESTPLVSGDTPIRELKLKHNWSFEQPTFYGTTILHNISMNERVLTIRAVGRWFSNENLIPLDSLSYIHSSAGLLQRLIQPLPGFITLCFVVCCLLCYYAAGTLSVGWFSVAFAFGIIGTLAILLNLLHIDKRYSPQLKARLRSLLLFNLIFAATFLLCASVATNRMTGDHNVTNFFENMNCNVNSTVTAFAGFCEDTVFLSWFRAALAFSNVCCVLVLFYFFDLYLTFSVHLVNIWFYTKKGKNFKTSVSPEQYEEIREVIMQQVFSNPK
jgi:hypothetical protein